MTIFEQSLSIKIFPERRLSCRNKPLKPFDLKKIRDPFPGLAQRLKRDEAVDRAETRFEREIAKLVKTRS